MQQAKIYWDMENYTQVEKIFRKSVEFCNEHDVWKLNVAHVLFMQDGKWKEATGFYEPIVKKHYDNVSFGPTCYNANFFQFDSVWSLSIHHFAGNPTLTKTFKFSDYGSIKGWIP